MYNLIKRALVTIDEKQTYPFVNDPKKNTQNEGPSEEKARQDDTQKTIPPEINLAKEKAKSILEQAREEAAKIENQAKAVLADAEKRAQQLVDQAQQEIETHKRDLQTQVEKAMETSFKALQIAVKTLEKNQNQYIELSAQEIALIVSSACQKILAREIDGQENTLIQRKIHQVMQRITNFRKTVFRFNSDDFHKFPKAGIDQIQSSLNHVEFRQDSSISRGSVVIDTDYGTLDSSIDSQMDILDGLIAEIVESGEAS